MEGLREIELSDGGWRGLRDMAGLAIVGMGIIASHEDDALSDRRSRAVEDLKDGEGYLTVVDK